MSWDYAELSHVAKEFGGPEELVAAIYDGGLTDGRIQGGAIVATIALAVGGITFFVNRAVECKRAKAAAAKAALVSKLNSEEQNMDDASEEAQSNQ